MFDNWKEKRKAKKEDKRSPYEKEELRLILQLRTLEPGTDEYDRIQGQLKSITQIDGEVKENKRRVSKADRGGIIIKILGIGGAALGLLSIIHAERDGLTFTGEKRSVMDAIASGIGRVFVRH